MHRQYKFRLSNIKILHRFLLEARMFYMVILSPRFCKCIIFISGDEKSLHLLDVYLEQRSELTMPKRKIKKGASLRRFVAGVLVLQMAASVSPAVSASETISTDPIFNPDYAQLIARSDLSYTGMIAGGYEGIPVANGRFGGPVWQPSQTTLCMQLNHTDTFMYNDASSESTTEGGALGQVYVDFGSAVFSYETQQHLSLYDGKLSITDENVEISVIAQNDKDAVAIHVNDKRENPQPITVELRMLRQPNVVRGEFSAISSFDLSNDGVAVLQQVFSEDCASGIEVNDFYCATAVALCTQDIQGEFSQAGAQSVKLTLDSRGGEFTIIIGGGSTMDESEDISAQAVSNAVNAPAYDEMYESNKAWWSDFWSKSYVYIPAQQDFEKRRNYYLYLAAISNRGNYPSKYNGGIWIGEGDRRDWGNWYWNWNQDSLYLPLYQANHAELMEPFFKMRESCYEQYEVAAEQLWGSEGIFIGETSGILGWETLPDDIAEDLREYYAGTGELTAELEEFAAKKNSYLVPWNYKISFSGTSVSWVSHTMVATQETAEHFWMKYCYDKDEEWLREHAYPFIKGAAEFYRNYYGFVKEEDGKYHFYRTNLHEHIGGGKDIIDDLSLARGTFAAAIAASEILGVDEDLRAEWQERLDNLADYPMVTDEGAIAYASADAFDGNVWAQGLEPSYYLRGLEGTESPKFKMLEKYDVLNMETRDQNMDDGQWETAINTYLSSPGYQNQYLNQLEDKNGSSRFLIDAAKLGRADDLTIMFPTQYQAFYDSPNWLHNEGDYYSAEGHGTFAAAIQEALNQSLAPTTGEEPVIRVFPAWPEAWDAKYKLAAQNGFIVSSSMTRGEVDYVEIESEAGEACLIRNPWDDNVVLYRNGVRETVLKGGLNDLLEFDTEEGDRIVLVKEGTDVDSLRTTELKSVSYFIINDDESNINYGGDWDEEYVAGNYRADKHVTKDADATLEYLFYGTGAELISDTGPDMGEIDVYIDGVFDQTIDCYSETPQQQVIVYTNSELDYAGHRIKLVNKSGDEMVVDGIVVRRTSSEKSVTVNDNDESISYVGEGWRYADNRTSEQDYMTDAHITYNDGDYVEYSFVGTGIGFMTEMYSDMGKIEVYVDGELVGEADCYTDSGRKSQQVIFKELNLEYGEHTIRVVKNGGQYMIVDGFAVWTGESMPLEEVELDYTSVPEKKKPDALPIVLAAAGAALVIAAAVTCVLYIRKKNRKNKAAK